MGFAILAILATPPPGHAQASLEVSASGDRVSSTLNGARTAYVQQTGDFNGDSVSDVRRTLSFSLASADAVSPATSSGYTGQPFYGGAEIVAFSSSSLKNTPVIQVRQDAAGTSSSGDDIQFNILETVGSSTVPLRDVNDNPIAAGRGGYVVMFKREDFLTWNAKSPFYRVDWYDKSGGDVFSYRISNALANATSPGADFRIVVQNDGKFYLSEPISNAADTLSSDQSLAKLRWRPYDPTSQIYAGPETGVTYTSIPLLHVTAVGYYHYNAGISYVSGQTTNGLQSRIDVFSADLSQKTRPTFNGRWYADDGSGYRQMFVSEFEVVGNTNSNPQSGKVDRLLNPDGENGGMYISGPSAALNLRLSFPDTIGAVTLRPRKLRLSTYADQGASTRYRVFTSVDGQNWGSVVASGTLNGDGTWAEVTLPDAEANYLSLRPINGTSTLSLNAIEIWGTITEDAAAKIFVRPLGLCDTAQLAWVKRRAAISSSTQYGGAATPQYKAHQKLKADDEAKVTYAPKTNYPTSHVRSGQPIDALIFRVNGVDPTTADSFGHDQFVAGDGEAIAKQAMMWICSGATAHAQKVLQILDTWSSQVRSIGGSNAYLSTGWTLASMVRAADIVKQTYSAWDPALEARFKEFAQRALREIERKRADGISGNGNSYNNNRGTTLLEASLALAIFNEDRYQFNRAVFRATKQLGTDTIRNGQLGEICRDISHAEFGSGGYIQIAEICHTQNWQNVAALDIYDLHDDPAGEFGDRARAMIEYLSVVRNYAVSGKLPDNLLPKYEPSNFIGNADWGATNRNPDKLILLIDRYPLTNQSALNNPNDTVADGITHANCAGYEIAYNHYVNRLGLTMPETKKRVEASDANNTWDWYVFHWGMGYLTHRDSANPADPAPNRRNWYSWMYQNFGTAARTGNSADSADPDGDGSPNLIEYAVGRNPIATDSTPSTTLGATSDGRLTLTFLRARADLTYVVEASNNLTSWTPVSPVNPGAVGQTYTYTDTVANPVSRFLRLTVTAP